MTNRPLYPKHNPADLEPHYSRHVNAMPGDEQSPLQRRFVAEQLAWRDKRIEELEARVAELQIEPAFMAARMIELDELREHLEYGCAVAAAHLEMAAVVSGGAPSNEDWGKWLRKENARIEARS